MKIKRNCPYLSLILLKDISDEELKEYPHGKHPCAAITQKIDRFENKLDDFITIFNGNIFDNEFDDLCDMFRQCCYATFELLETYRSVFGSLVVTNRKRAKRVFLNHFKTLRNDIAYIVNKCKHEGADIRPIIYYNNKKSIAGFVLVKYCDGDTLEVDKYIHKNRKAISFRRYIFELLYIILSLDEKLYTVLSESSGRKNKCDSELQRESTIKLFDKMINIEDLVFPNELKLPVKSLSKISKNKYELSVKKYKIKTLKEGHVRVVYKGDGFTRKFSFARI